MQEENRRLKGYNESPPTERNYKSYHTRATGNDRKRSSFKVKEKLGEYEDLISQIKKVSS